MILSFLNGNEVQKQVFREAIASLLYYPTDSIALTELQVEFVADPDEGKQHNEFAICETPPESGEYTYNQGVARVRVREDFPRFPLPWNGLGFARETAIHEVAHGVFANLPPGTRLEICTLFGATTDDLAVINDHSKPWEKRVIEGIAETFKDAFLPQRLRRYANRTERRISIRQYPEFRRLFRGGKNQGFNYVYGSSSFREDLSKWGLVDPPTHLSEFDDEAFVFYGEIPGYEECWGVDMSQFPESGELPFSIVPDESIAT